MTVLSSPNNLLNDPGACVGGLLLPVEFHQSSVTVE